MAVAQWPVQPAAHQATAHGGNAFIHYGYQAVLLLSGLCLIEFQVASRGSIHDDAVLPQFAAQSA